MATWIDVRYDDAGKLVVRVHASREFAVGHPPCVVGEDVTDKLPAELKTAMSDAFKKLLDLATPSATVWADAAAVEMLHAIKGIAKPGVRTIHLTGKVAVEGSQVGVKADGSSE